LRENSQTELDRLCRQLDYQFKRKDLLNEALSHRSFSACNYERLEFLGDSVLNFIIAAELFHRHPTLDEGSLSRLRATLVRGTTLSEIARELKLGDYLQLGSGELKSGGYERDSILADAVEAIIGAVLEDAGFDTCQSLVQRLYRQRLDDLPAAAELKDPKTRLQEKLQGAGLPVPNYSVIDTAGEAHARQFTVRCDIPDLKLSHSATASSRRKAEQAAATLVLENESMDSLND